MDRLSRGILGGIAGGFEAQEEVIDANMKERRDQAKQKALLKRQKNLARFQNDLAMDRQEAGWGQQEKVREEERDYQEGLLEEGRSYQDEKQEKIHERKIDRLKTEYNLKEKLLSAKNDAKGIPKDQYDRLKENAFAGLRATLSHIGGSPDPLNEDQFILPDEGMSDNQLKNFKDTIKQFGYTVLTKRKDEQIIVDIGGFNPGEVVTGSRGKQKSKDHFKDLFLKTVEAYKIDSDKKDGSDGGDNDGIVSPSGDGSGGSTNEQPGGRFYNPDPLAPLEDWKNLGEKTGDAYNQWLVPAAQSITDLFLTRPYNEAVRILEEQGKKQKKSRRSLPAYGNNN